MPAPVSFTRQRLVQDYYNINNQIKVTGNHKFYTHRGLVKAEELFLGDLLYNGQDYLPIFSLQNIDEKAEVYTLGVEKYNNYFAEGILVHNEHNSELPTGCYGTGTDNTCSNQYNNCLDNCQDNPSSFNPCVECNPVARCVGSSLDECINFSTRSECVNRGCSWGVE